MPFVLSIWDDVVDGSVRVPMDVELSRSSFFLLTNNVRSKEGS